MSRRFSQVPLNLWDNPAFKSLPDDGKVATLYFWSGQHSTSAGIGVVKDGYAVADLGWSLDKWEAARQIVELAGLIRRDAETQTVLVVGYLLANRPSNTKHRAAILSQIAGIQCPELKSMAEAEFAGEAMQSSTPNLKVVPTVSPQLQAVVARNGWIDAA